MQCVRRTALYEARTATVWDMQDMLLCGLRPATIKIDQRHTCELLSHSTVGVPIHLTHRISV